jgi:hypothetical protein
MSISAVEIGRIRAGLFLSALAPTLKRIAGEDAELTIEAPGDDPMAKLSFRAEATETVVSALKEALKR